MTVARNTIRMRPPAQPSFPWRPPGEFMEHPNCTEKPDQQHADAGGPAVGAGFGGQSCVRSGGRPPEASAYPALNMSSARPTAPVSNERRPPPRRHALPPARCPSLTRGAREETWMPARKCWASFAQ